MFVWSELWPTLLMLSMSNEWENQEGYLRPCNDSAPYSSFLLATNKCYKVVAIVSLFVITPPSAMSSQWTQVSQQLIRERLLQFQSVRSALFSSWNDEGHEMSSERKTMLWKACPKCRGEAKIRRPPSKKDRMKHQRQLQERKKDEHDERRQTNQVECSSTSTSIRTCDSCSQTWILESTEPMEFLDCYTSIVIVGGGLGGLALGIACSHRGIPFHVLSGIHPISCGRFGLVWSALRK